MNLFLVTAAQQVNSSTVNTGAILGLSVALTILFLVLSLGIYIYMSFAYMAIARKNKQSAPGIAWIPAVGPLIVAFRSSKMHWWPWLLIIGFIIPILNIIAVILFAFFEVVWHWKMFEAVKKPGWWSIFMIIPVLNLVYLVFIGVAAWSE